MATKVRTSSADRAHSQHFIPVPWRAQAQDKLQVPMETLLILCLTFLFAKFLVTLMPGRVRPAVHCGAPAVCLYFVVFKVELHDTVSQLTPNLPRTIFLHGQLQGNCHQ